MRSRVAEILRTWEQSQEDMDLGKASKTPVTESVQLPSLSLTFTFGTSKTINNSVFCGQKCTITQYYLLHILLKSSTFLGKNCNLWQTIISWRKWEEIRVFFLFPGALFSFIQGGRKPQSSCYPNNFCGKLNEI